MFTAVEHDVPQRFSQFRAARIAARHHRVPQLAQPVAQQVHLCRLADSVDAVKAQEHRGTVSSFLRRPVSGGRTAGRRCRFVPSPRRMGRILGRSVGVRRGAGGSYSRAWEAPLQSRPWGGGGTSVRVRREGIRLAGGTGEGGSAVAGELDKVTAGKCGHPTTDSPGSVCQGRIWKCPRVTIRLERTAPCRFAAVPCR